MSRDRNQFVKYLGTQLLDHIIRLDLTLYETAELSCKLSFYSHNSGVKFAVALYLYQQLIFPGFKNVFYSDMCAILSNNFNFPNDE